MVSVLWLALYAQVPSSMLVGLRPSDAVGVVGDVSVVADGVMPHDGTAWDDPTGVRVLPQGHLTYDLGAVRQIRAVTLQADNNDIFAIDGSNDGTTWATIWQAPAHPMAGLQMRGSGPLEANARFVRLTPLSGDGNYSVSEFSLWADAQHAAAFVPARPPAYWPESAVERDAVKGFTWWAALCLGVLVFVGRRLTQGSSRLVAGLVLAAAGGAWWHYDAVWNPSMGVAWVRLCAALVLAGALLRLASAKWLGEMQREPWLAIAGSAAVIGLLCFPNLLHPQFYDAGKQRPTFLHFHDMRVYYPVAKYHRELHFDGVYAASVSALASLQHGGALEPLQGERFRSLTTHRMESVEHERPHIEEVRQRFTEGRFQQFSTDMAYFARGMGRDGYLRSMVDHGGNATPVWFLTAKLLFGEGPVDDSVLWRGVWLDIALVILSLYAVFRTFGLHSMLVVACVFGVNDFIMFGSNWFGATLRHDWLSLWCLGICALRAEKPLLAGALLSWAALIRAFPALALLLPGLALVAELVMARGEGLVEKVRQSPVLKLALGAMGWGSVVVGASTAVFGLDAWKDWYVKVTLLNADNHINNVAVKAWFFTNQSTFQLFVVMSVLAMTLLVRRMPVWRQAALAMVLLPLVFNLANYYLHTFCLLPLALGTAPLKVPSRTQLLGLTALCLTCVACWFTVGLRDEAEHFRLSTVVLLAGCAALVWAAKRDEQEQVQ
jgi:hypothetical protein